ncbi:14305_t:CDS:2 [Dentiscutata erythropus]|uniref:14305_t:CDS:1 n=1 Tax=Dentiscutata erythropus TaxID=1348616 RepID=A0A9N9CG95_9GLOM|nr:14305_t:CDS:2 [Dentiscutata erythropus]
MSIEPTFHGYIETTQDTLLIFEACRKGCLTKICRRLQEKERKIITSGSVFVFDERESGIKRWTDGLVWSPSRILGNFLIYRELDKRPPTGKKDSSPVERQRSDSVDMESQSEKNKERALVGSLTNTYRFKKGGLIKKTMSIMVNGVSQHMISYYTKEDVLAGKLKTPSSMPNLAILEISPEFLLKQNFRIPPVVESNYEQELDGMTYGKQSSASPHAILPKPGDGTVSPARLSNMDFSPSRIKMEMEASNSCIPSHYSNYSSTMHPVSHFAPYASQGHVPNESDGSHTLSMPPMRALMNRQSSFHEFPPLTSHVNNITPSRLLTSHQQPLIPSIGSHQNDYNYHTPQNNTNTQNWSGYQYPPYSSNAPHALHPSISHQAQSNNPHAETSNDMFYANTTTAGNNSTNSTINTLSNQVPLYTTGNPYHDLSSTTFPDIYNPVHSSTTNSISHSHLHQHEYQVTSPSPTLPSISSPASTTSTYSSNAPVTPPLNSPVNSGFNSNYYPSLIKNEGFQPVHMLYNFD